MTFITSQHGAQVRVVNRVYTHNDVAGLAQDLDLLRALNAPVARLMPESHQVKKRFLRSDIPVESGYEVGLQIGVGKSRPAQPLPLVLYFMLPETAALASSASAQKITHLGDHGVHFPADWQVEDGFGRAGLHLEAADINACPSPALAFIMMEGLRAFGATTPTNNWSMQIILSRRERLGND